jgi:hypothetical protein
MDPRSATQQIELEESDVEKRRIQRDQEEWAKSLDRIRIGKNECGDHAHERVVNHLIRVTNQCMDNNIEIQGMNKNMHRVVEAVNDMRLEVAVMHTGLNDIQSAVQSGGGGGATMTIKGVKIPVRYVFATLLIAMLAAALVIIEAMRQDKLAELADAIQIARGQAAKAERIDTIKPPPKQ